MGKLRLKSFGYLVISLFDQQSQNKERWNKQFIPRKLVIIMILLAKPSVHWFFGHKA